MELKFPFDPIKRAEETEKIVMKGDRRLYYRFRPAPYYGGIATADAVGCQFLCAYCWNYKRNLDPGKSGKFYSAEAVASKLLAIAEKKSFHILRITGSEPVLGRQSFNHLIQVMETIFKKKPAFRFVLETNGFMLGYESEFVKHLKFPNLCVRVAVKGADEDSFELITGAKKEFFLYPVRAVRYLQKENIEAWPAVMQDFFAEAEIGRLKNVLGNEGVEGDIEFEKLEKYPFVLDNIEKRGVKF